MNYTYRIYCIKNNISGKYFCNVTSSDNNMFGWLLLQNKKSGKYAELAESVKTDGRNNHTYTTLSKVYNKRIDAENDLFKLLTKLKENEKLINSIIIDPKRIKCTHCNREVREIFLDEHLKKYCTKSINDELDNMMAESVSF